MFPQIFGKYVLERELASGGMARVYLATLRGAVGFEKRLVVKQIRPELSRDEAFVRRFVEEAKLAVELSHPNIVPVYELGVEQGTYYIAMELCEGLTLSEVLAESGPLDAAEGAHLGIEICRALGYAHRRAGIVHRDVTPRNVLLDEEGAVRLIDFGIAAPVTGARSRERVEVFGSPGHMPPEQMRGERLTPATDVFAVAALLVEAWTGRPPFRRESFEASRAALAEPLVPLSRSHSELSPVSDVLLQALSPNASERPQQAELLARKLRDFSRQFDSGDVASRLGARVRKARGKLDGSARARAQRTPAASPRADSERPARHTPAAPALATGSPATRTFAARDDLAQWTRKLSSLPPPPPSDEAADPAGRADDELDGTPPPPLPPAPSEPATRALPPSGPPPKPARRLASAVAVAGLAVVAVVAAAGSGADGPRAAQPGPKRSALAPSAPPAPPSVSPLSPLASAIGSSPLVALSASSGPGARARSAAARAAWTAPARSESATLKLTADPPASVTVTGGKVSQTHATPVRALPLPAGSYTLTFRSATFGEPVVARVELLSGGGHSVHVDFRAAIPTVVVR
jgi:eukaryotic-like serine/threonine-protein kinase